jgi:hypothetical protein
MSATLLFPDGIKDENGNVRFVRHRCENYKRALMGMPPIEPDRDAPIEFVTPRQFADELAISRRQLGRKMAAKAVARHD